MAPVIEKGGLKILSIGPSASGKSSFLAILLGLRDFSKIRGHAFVDEQCLFDVEKNRAAPVSSRGFAWVPQDGAIFPHLNVRQNLYFAYPESTEKRTLSDRKVIEVLGIKHILDRWPQTLSGGEKQRVVLGRALLSMRPILLLDEPVSSLDADLKAEVLRYIKNVTQEFSVSMLYVSHDPAEINYLCDTSLTVKNGVFSIR